MNNLTKKRKEELRKLVKNAIDYKDYLIPFCQNISEQELICCFEQLKEQGGSWQKLLEDLFISGYRSPDNFIKNSYEDRLNVIQAKKRIISYLIKAYNSEELINIIDYFKNTLKKADMLPDKIIKKDIYNRIVINPKSDIYEKFYQKNKDLKQYVDKIKLATLLTNSLFEKFITRNYEQLYLEEIVKLYNEVFLDNPIENINEITMKNLKKLSNFLIETKSENTSLDAGGSFSEIFLQVIFSLSDNIGIGYNSSLNDLFENDEFKSKISEINYVDIDVQVNTQENLFKALKLTEKDFSQTKSPEYKIFYVLYKEHAITIVIDTSKSYEEAVKNIKSVIKIDSSKATEFDKYNFGFFKKIPSANNTNYQQNGTCYINATCACLVLLLNGYKNIKDIIDENGKLKRDIEDKITNKTSELFLKNTKKIEQEKDYIVIGETKEGEVIKINVKQKDMILKYDVLLEYIERLTSCEENMEKIIEQYKQKEINLIVKKRQQITYKPFKNLIKNFKFEANVGGTGVKLYFEGVKGLEFKGNSSAEYDINFMIEFPNIDIDNINDEFLKEIENRILKYGLDPEKLNYNIFIQGKKQITGIIIQDYYKDISDKNNITDKNKINKSLLEQFFIRKKERKLDQIKLPKGYILPFVDKDNCEIKFEEIQQFVKKIADNKLEQKKLTNFIFQQCYEYLINKLNKLYSVGCNIYEKRKNFFYNLYKCNKQVKNAFKDFILKKQSGSIYFTDVMKKILIDKIKEVVNDKNEIKEEEIFSFLHDDLIQLIFKNNYYLYDKSIDDIVENCTTDEQKQKQLYIIIYKHILLKKPKDIQGIFDNIDEEKQMLLLEIIIDYADDNFIKENDNKIKKLLNNIDNTDKIIDKYISKKIELILNSSSDSDNKIKQIVNISIELIQILENNKDEKIYNLILKKVENEQEIHNELKQQFEINLLNKNNLEGFLLIQSKDNKIEITELEEKLNKLRKDKTKYKTVYKGLKQILRTKSNDQIEIKTTGFTKKKVKVSTKSKKIKLQSNIKESEINLLQAVENDIIISLGKQEVRIIK